ncbi:hypothetical protein DFH09DRAFT_1075302 [Mycena vulgaris]|nr:hypothetical protein DFH09DRAFT_1075302 [Mycena vulgaris]
MQIISLASLASAFLLVSMTCAAPALPCELNASYSTLETGGQGCKYVPEVCRGLPEQLLACTGNGGILIAGRESKGHSPRGHVSGSRKELAEVNGGACGSPLGLSPGQLLSANCPFERVHLPGPRSDGNRRDLRILEVPSRADRIPTWYNRNTDIWKPKNNFRMLRTDRSNGKPLRPGGSGWRPQIIDLRSKEFPAALAACFTLSANAKAARPWSKRDLPASICSVDREILHLGLKRGRI